MSFPITSLMIVVTVQYYSSYSQVNDLLSHSYKINYINFVLVWLDLYNGVIDAKML